MSTPTMPNIAPDAPTPSALHGPNAYEVALAKNPAKRYIAT
jgi:hypothetical protein